MANKGEKRSSLVLRMSNPFGPRTIRVSRKNFMAGFSQLALTKIIKTNDAVFDREFDVFCREEGAALEFLTAGLREALMAKRETFYALEIENNNLVLRHQDILRTVEQYRHFIDEGMDLFNRICDTVNY